MKKSAYLFALFFCFTWQSFAQCNTNDATTCACENTSQVCDLLPDITAAYDMLVSPFLNPESLGELGISVSTPNLGYGPLRVLPMDSFVCGIDTIFSPGGLTICPDGSAPNQLIKQRIYQKNGNQMTYYDRAAGSMTYHPTHNHMHVDNWGVYTLRTEVPGTNPLTWPIIGNGTKLGFCLMDFGSCDTYYGHCRDVNNNIMTNTNFPNYGLGGAQYSCGSFNQGISVGFTDVYDYTLDGMFIDIPPGTCNGDYKIVVEIDPNNNFLESNELNNVVVAPITLNKQSDIAQGAIDIDGPTVLCNGESTILTANFGNSFIWSTGENSQSITVSQAGNYHCSITTVCGVIESDTISFSFEIENQLPFVNNVSLCSPGQANLVATSSGTPYWYDDAAATNLIGIGNNILSPPISASTTLYVRNEVMIAGEMFNNPPANNSFGGGGYNVNSTNGHLIFDATLPFTLNTVKVYAQTLGNRTFELRDEFGNVLQQTTLFLQVGENICNLNFNVSVGNNYQLGCNQSPDLYRNNIGVFYPYETPGILSITGTNFGDSYYYYFYDWQIQLEDSYCLSDAVSFQVSVSNQNVSFSGLPTITNNSSPIDMVGLPAGGYFSGPGVLFNSFNPVITGPGLFTVSYNYTGSDGCMAVASQNILVAVIGYNFVNYNLGVIDP